MAYSASQIYTARGLVILKCLPSIDFSASTNLFPEGRFDILWQAASYRAAIASGLRTPDTEYEKLMSLCEYDELMAQAEDKWAMPDSSGIDTMIPDVDGLLADFMSEEQSLAGL